MKLPQYKKLLATFVSFAIFACCSTDVRAAPTADDLISLGQSGASVYFYRWGCIEATENEIRLDVIMFSSRYVNESGVRVVMAEFDKELERLGFGNPYTKRRCDQKGLDLKSRLYTRFKAELQLK